MKKALVMLFAVVMLATVILPGISTVDAADGDPITGKIFDTDGVALTGVTVTVEMESGAESDATSITGGTFSVPVGTGEVPKRIMFECIKGTTVYYVSMTNLARDAANNQWFTLGNESDVGIIIMSMMMPGMAADLTGTISAGDGTPLEDVTVTVYPEGTVPGPTDSVVTGADGTFAFPALDSFQGTDAQKTFITYVVEFESETHSVSSVTGLEKVGPDKFEVILTRSVDARVTMGTDTGVIAGTLYSETGALSKVDMALLDDTGVPVLDKDGVPITCKTDSGGGFKFTELNLSSTYIVKFINTPYEIITVGDVGDIIDGETWKVTPQEKMNTVVVMERTTGDLFVKVVNQDGNPLGGVIVTIVDKATGKTIEVQTEGNGTKRVVLDKGDYEVSVSRTNYDSQTSFATIDPTQPELGELEFTLTMVMNTYLFGLDLPHSLMVGGLGLGIVLILAMAGYRIKIGKTG